MVVSWFKTFHKNRGLRCIWQTNTWDLFLPWAYSWLLALLPDWQVTEIDWQVWQWTPQCIKPRMCGLENAMLSLKEKFHSELTVVRWLPASRLVECAAWRGEAGSKGWGALLRPWPDLCYQGKRKVPWPWQLLPSGTSSRCSIYPGGTGLGMAGRWISFENLLPLPFHPWGLCMAEHPGPVLSPFTLHCGQWAPSGQRDSVCFAARTALSTD